MDTPRTPEIFVPAETFSYLAANCVMAPVPDEVIRDSSNDPRIYVYGFHMIGALDSATEEALEFADEDAVVTRLVTLKNILTATRTAIEVTNTEIPE